MNIGYDAVYFPYKVDQSVHPIERQPEGRVMSDSTGTSAPAGDPYRVQISGPGLSVDEKVSEALAHALVRHLQSGGATSTYAEETLMTQVEPVRRTPENS